MRESGCYKVTTELFYLWVQPWTNFSFRVIGLVHIEQNLILISCLFSFFQITLSFYIGFLLFEDFPTSIIICGIISQVAHLFILKTFPFVVIASPAFIVAVIMLIVNHYLAFQYFAVVYYSFPEVCLPLLLILNVDNFQTPSKQHDFAYKRIKNLNKCKYKNFIFYYYLSKFNRQKFLIVSDSFIYVTTEFSDII